MSERKAMVCPKCGNVFESEVANLAFIPIQLCPTCGPIADIFTMADRIQKLEDDTVEVTLQSQQATQLAKALKLAHPDFHDAKIGDALRHVRENAPEGVLRFKLPRYIAGMAELVVNAECPTVSVVVSGA